MLGKGEDDERENFQLTTGSEFQFVTSKRNKRNGIANKPVDVETTSAAQKD